MQINIHPFYLFIWFLLTRARSANCKYCRSMSRGAKKKNRKKERKAKKKRNERGEKSARKWINNKCLPGCKHFWHRTWHMATVTSVHEYEYEYEWVHEWVYSHLCVPVAHVSSGQAHIFIRIILEGVRVRVGPCPDTMTTHIKSSLTTNHNCRKSSNSSTRQQQHRK